MSRKGLLEVTAVLLLGLCCCRTARAEGSLFSYTPYSVYGIGDRNPSGNACNRGMGGVGIAMRDNTFLNMINPAAVTARDSLSFMADFSVYGENKIFAQGGMKSGSNTFNVGSLALSFPLIKTSAFMIGLMPYSSTGYGYSYNQVNPVSGPVTYASTGSGSIYQAFAGVGVTLFKRLSIGGEFIYYFGNMDKSYSQSFQDASYIGYSGGYRLELNSVGGKFGLQYEQPLGTKSRLTLGVTHTLGSALKGYVTDYMTAKVDTLSNMQSAVRLASETGAGLCFKYADKFTVEFDYTRSDWKNSGFSEMGGFDAKRQEGVFSPTVQNEFRLGTVYIPNRTDIRYYFKRCTYRAGAYYRNEYYSIDGRQINSMGITLGMTLPVFRWSNGLSLAVDLGQRGSTAGNLIRERYVNLTVGMNLYDIWFQKPKYD